jgi:NADH-quinone oxidoreductase subunit G
MRIDHRDGTIFRLLPRRNTEVNRSWLCDEGRLIHHELDSRERLARPMMKGRDQIQAPVTWKDAVQAIDARLKSIAETHGAGSVMGFASASATNEALFLFRKYLAEHIGATQFDFRLDGEDKKVTEPEDKILRHLDKHPNSMGAIKLGLWSDELGGIEGAIRAAREGRIKAGVVVYFKPLVRREGDSEAEARLAQLLNALEYSVVLTPERAPWLIEADVALPVAMWAEEDGSYTNYQGRVQMAGKAIEPGGDIMGVWEVFAMLIQASGGASPWMSPDDVFQMMAESVPAYRGITLEQRQLPGALATP